MVNVLVYSALGFASGFAPSLTALFVIRALFGIAMGGEWGVGASLAMETIPPESRGVVSGVLQVGYPTGYLIAGLAYASLYSTIGWRGMFMLGCVPALLVLFIRRRVTKSPAFEAFGPGVEALRVLPGAQATRLVVRLYGRPHGGLQPLQPRHARPLPDFPASPERPVEPRRRHHQCDLQYRRNHRRPHVRRALRAVRTPACNRPGLSAGTASHSAMGVCSEPDLVRRGCLPHAVLRARGLGRSSGAPQRTVPRARPAGLSRGWPTRSAT